LLGNDCSDFVPTEHLPSLARGALDYDDESDHAVVYLGEPIHSGSVFIERDDLANATAWSTSAGSGRTPRSVAGWASGRPH